MELIFLYLTFPFFIYWCINEKIGFQLSIVVLLSIWIIFIYRDLREYIPVNIDFTWIIIAVIFCGYLYLRSIIEALLAKGGIRACIITTAVVSFLMILYRSSFEFILPGGILLGLGIGYCINKHYIGFKSSGVPQKKGIIKYFILFIRFLLGMTILVLIIFRIEIFIRQFSENQNIYLYSFICYIVTSFWVSVAAPWIFIKLRLAGTADAEQNQ
jgi:hypothetical protein